MLTLFRLMSGGRGKGLDKVKVISRVFVVDLDLAVEVEVKMLLATADGIILFSTPIPGCTSELQEQLRIQRVRTEKPRQNDM